MPLRTATVADVQTLLQVQHSCPEAPQWSETVWRKVFEGARRALIVQDEEDVCGFVVMNLVAGTGELENIAVLKHVRRQGVARALCENALAWARDQGAESIELEVRALNEGALRLYTSMGFGEEGRRSKYYRDPVDDAVLMRLAL